MFYLLSLSPVHDSEHCCHFLPPKSMRELARLSPPTSLSLTRLEKDSRAQLSVKTGSALLHVLHFLWPASPNYPLLPVVVNCCSGKSRSAEVPGRYRGRSRYDRNGFSCCYSKRGLNSERRNKAASFSTCRCWAIDMEMRFGDAARIFTVFFLTGRESLKGRHAFQKGCKLGFSVLVPPPPPQFKSDKPIRIAAVFQSRTKCIILPQSNVFQ